MESKEIIEGNKMIAEFMGLILHKPDKTFNIEQWWSGDSSDGRKKGEFVGYSHQLEYNTSWDWLMPVVDKIEKLGFDSRIHGNNSDDGYLCDFIQDNTNNEISCFVTWQDNGGTKIEATFKAVVEFIKWYNENKNN
jgi:hypothetical protein